ncbi:MAG TPA: hypothetical protein VI248_25610, partial [Kineosporiaceae bacterium]
TVPRPGEGEKGSGRGTAIRGLRGLGVRLVGGREEHGRDRAGFGGGGGVLTHVEGAEEDQDAAAVCGDDTLVLAAYDDPTLNGVNPVGAVGADLGAGWLHLAAYV